MGYYFLEHTADVRMRVKGRNLKELFQNALEGMFAFLNPQISQDTKMVERKINLKAPDKTVLLIDFLNEILYLANTNKEYYYKINFEKLTKKNIKATILGKKILNFSDDIKAVTYHEAEIKKLKNKVLETIIIFDI